MLKKMSTISKFSLFYIGLIVILAILAPILPLKPYDLATGKSLEAPSRDHILGTDDLGMDIFSQILNGARISLLVGISIALISVSIGLVVGVITGYYGGLVDLIIMRIIDVLIALPELPLMIVLASFFGPSIKNIIFSLSFLGWVRPARIIRSRVMALKEEDYILAARSYGAGFIHLTRYHFLRDLSPILLISLMKLVSRGIITEASLAFIGLGDPISKSWGMILNHALNFPGIYFTDYWKWWVMSPLMALILLILSISFLSKELEKVWD